MKKKKLKKKKAKIKKKKRKFLCSGWKLDGRSAHSGCLLQKMKKRTKLCRAFKPHQRKKRRRGCAEAGSVYSTRCCRMLLPGEVAKMQLLGRLLPRNLVGKTKKKRKRWPCLSEIECSMKTKLKKNEKSGKLDKKTSAGQCFYSSETKPHVTLAAVTLSCVQ